MEMVRAALVGFGGMGSKYAQMICDGNIPGLKLSGICCRNRGGQETIGRLYPQVSVYRDTEEMFSRREEYDAVIIVTPHDTHVEIGKRAASLGVHILCDKPLGVSTKEVRELLEACELAKVKLGTIFNVRAHGGYQTARTMVREGSLGRISRAVWICNTWFRTPAYHSSAPWRSTWSGEHGGLLVNQCQHFLDIWQWIFGMPYLVDASLEFGKFNDIRVDDSVDLRFFYENGMRGNFISSSGEAPGVNRLEIWGTKGRLTVENHDVVMFDENVMTTEAFGKVNREIYGVVEHEERQVDAGPQQEPYSYVFRKFADAVRFGKPMAADGQDGLNTLMLANGAYLSQWLGKRIEFPIDDGQYARMLAEVCGEAT